MPDISIRRVSDLIEDIDNGTLILQPEFQRRLVWTNVVKDNFLDTVIKGLPFPEIFIATGAIDTQSMRRKNLLVDGQQRISALRQYVHESTDLVLKKVKRYAELTESEKTAFLDYKVAVRELGTVTKEEVIDIFTRINSTDYSLKAIERMNALFSGAYKEFCDKLSRHAFFETHNVFSMSDKRRMRDLDFCVILATTLLSTYYQRDALNLEYLKLYNDEFPQSGELSEQIEAVFEFIDECDFQGKRVWRKTDLFTLLVELHAALIVKKLPLDRSRVKLKLEEFYSQVDAMYAMGGADEELEAKAPSPSVFRYLKAATKATNDKYARVDRADVVSGILESSLGATTRRPRKASPKKPKESSRQ